MTARDSSKTDRNRSNPKKDIGGPDGEDLKQSPSRGKLWLMRAMAAILMPALLLGSLELGLRAVGFGYSTRFWEPGTVDGQEYLFTNHKFTHRFFPPGLTRSPVPHRIRVEKPTDTYRIIVFGESAANGDPEAAYSLGRHMEILLQERFPGTNFEVICTAITAINSHAILPIARECAQLDSDLWIVYMGNNEMVGTFGAGTVFSSKAPSLASVRAILALKSTRLGQLLDSLYQGLKRDTSVPSSWRGIDMFTENPLRPDDPGRLQVYENFRGNLEDILQAGEKADVPVLLSTVGSNLKDCGPFVSLHSDKLSMAQLAEWQSFYEQGKALEAAGSFPEALEQYAQAAAIDPDYAELQFRIGRCHRDNRDEAMQALQRARDTDGLVVRADSQINTIIRETADQHKEEQVVLVDAAELLANASPGGIPGQELFYEHVHYTLQGNYRMARILADKVIDVLPSRIKATDQKSWADPIVCHLQLAVTFWDKNRLWTDMGERIAVPPFTERVTNTANLAYFEKNAEVVNSRINSRIDRKIYELALEKNPDDYHLRARHGHYLENNGSLEEAIKELEWVCDAFPEFEGGHQELGIALVLAGRYGEAENRFERVLEIRPDYANAKTALEVIRKGKFNSND